MEGSQEMISRLEAADFYMTVKEQLISDGYAPEIDWQYDISFEQVCESKFLMEGAWVILASGFRESVLRKKFPAIGTAFMDWDCSRIALRSESCVSEAMQVFGHSGKIRAIAKLAETVHRVGIDAIKVGINSLGLAYLQQFAYIGPITAIHFGKSLGLPLVKPDRHLVRIANEHGFECPSDMCACIAKIVGDPLQVIDIVLWRYGAIRSSRRASHRSPIEESIELGDMA
jgi:hypothetical protein